MANEWDLSKVSENLTQSQYYFDMSVTVSAAEGLFISPTGHKMYVVTSGTNDKVYEYNLSRNYDVSTATYVQSLDVNSQENNPREVVFKTDGTKMYLIGSTGDDINQYSLSTAWDLSTASFDSVTLSVSSVETTPQGIAFKPDGTKLFITGASSDVVAQATLSTAWDLSTATLDTNTFSVATQETSPEDIAFKSDGTKMYVMGSGGDDINEYTLSTAWDITTATYSQTSSSFTGQTSPVGFIFNSNGTEVYVLNNDTTNGHHVKTYSLSTAWDVATLAFKKPTTDYFEITQESSPYAVFFKSDGLKMYVIGSSDFVYEYDLGTAWNVHTASYLQSYDVDDQETNPKGLFFKSDGTKMYVSGSSGDDVNQYTLSTAWDVTTATFDNVTFSFATQETSHHNIFFKSDGTELYNVGSSSDSVHQYTLSTAWDISTASFTRSFSVATQDTSPQGVFFKSDGTRMYVSGNDVQEYLLSTAWDISTATHNHEYQPNFSGSLRGMFWRPNGETMFILDGGNPDTITAHYVQGATLPNPPSSEVTGLRATVIEYKLPKAEVTGLRAIVIEKTPTAEGPKQMGKVAFSVGLGMGI
jgi:DNA-binding beta-propeller fold protein YncE